ncbi:hypothetical protein FOZ62_001768 [Perkinsus olseni]|uniref:Protein arginine methyltransferase 10 n=1 Tax=Perkinsus olseni TaxID=32597 RepID=A0A7J6T141_PEROL|nr:hypothetical protein FOZ62_001768 [Perkinsus olseni]
MWTAIFLVNFVIIASVASHHYEFHLETKLYCVEGLKDAQGKPPPCSKSISTHTAGLTLPGMEDGKSLMFRSHVIVGSDGSETKVEAHPSYPYQYFMTTTTPELVTVHSLRNGESFFIGSAPPQAHKLHIKADDSLSLEEDGWTPYGSLVENDGVRQNLWAKYGFKGVDPATGFHHSYAHEANLAPDTWTLFMDEHNEKPLKLVASNSMHDNAYHQEVLFTRFHKNNSFLTADQAKERLFYLYEIGNHHNQGASRRLRSTRKHLDTFGSAVDSLLSGHIPSDPGKLIHSAAWLKKHHKSSSIIPYFAAKAGSAAAKYFGRHIGSRRLVAFDFQYPKGCQAWGGTKDFCIAIQVSAANDSYADGYLHVDFPNVQRTERGAILDVDITMWYDDFDLDFEVNGDGCSVVYRLGSSVSISVTICVEATGNCNCNLDTGICIASIQAWAYFRVHLPNPIGNIIEITLTSNLDVLAGPAYFMRANGSIGTSASIDIPSASASITFHFVAVFVDKYLQKWHLTGWLTFDAQISFLFWNPSRHKQFPLFSHAY